MSPVPVQIQDPFTTNELELLSGLPVAMQYLGNADAGMTAGEVREHIRKTWLRPPTLQEKLGHYKYEPECALVVKQTVQRLELLEKVFFRRPIAELNCREPYGPDRDGTATRYVILWGPSGYNSVEWRCAVGRRDTSRTLPDDRRWLNHAGDGFTDDGPPPTHFSELPDGFEA